MSSRKQCALNRAPLLTSTIRDRIPLISTMFLSVLFFLGTFAVFNCCICIAQENGSESAKRQPVVVKLEKPTFSTVQISVDIGSIERGKTTTVPLRFESNIGGDITFKDVVVQCACTGARIPDEAIKLGQSLIGEVDLTVSKNERSLSKVFSLEIKTLGSIERILIDLKAKVSNVVAFSQELYSVSIDSNKLESEKTIALSLPIIASPEVNLDELRVIVSVALYEIEGKSIAAEFKAYSDQQLMKGIVGAVVIRIESRAIQSDSEYFTVQVEGRHFPTQTTQVALRKKLPVSLVPEALFFSSTDLANVQAFGIIRIANSLDASSFKLISAKLETGEQLEHKVVSSGGTVVRLELTCSKEQASKWKQSTKNLEILVECDGKHYPINARCHFQW